MELYVGGRGQDKLNYVMKQHPELGAFDVFDAESDDIESIHEKRVIDHFHMLIKRGAPDELIEALLAADGLIVISDEVGLGVIPDNLPDIRYRENVGRYLCRFASKAERFERIVCGIGQRLK